MYMAECVQKSLGEIEAFLKAEMENIKAEGIAKCSEIGLEQFKLYVAHMDEVENPDNEETHPEEEPDVIERYIKMPWKHWGRSKQSNFKLGTAGMVLVSVAGLALLF